jgi:hypothetical protein
MNKSAIGARLITIALLCMASEINLYARSISKDQAKAAATGWLASPQGSRTPQGDAIDSVESFALQDIDPAYYVATLTSGGFVILSADDRIEPVIAFVPQGHYTVDSDNPLYALVTNDLYARYQFIRTAASTDPRLLSAQQRWYQLYRRRSVSHSSSRLHSFLLNDVRLDDMRVEPLLETDWGQSICCGSPALACYNYYTPPYVPGDPDSTPGDPNNDPAGCVAAALGQLMYYHRDPVNSYQWDTMAAIPDCGSSEATRQAIGGLLFDIGLAVNMVYDPNGSTASLLDAKTALLDVFQYGNAIYTFQSESSAALDWINIVNSNLDARQPVLLGIYDHLGESRSLAHVAVCDGYGYHEETLYHHLNLGWNDVYWLREGRSVVYSYDDIWYALPEIVTSTANQYNVIGDMLYNLFSNTTGEIISGRITDGTGTPLENVNVDLIEAGQVSQTTGTDNHGIYAFKGCISRHTYQVQAQGYPVQEVKTGLSEDNQPFSGNRRAIDFPAEGQAAILYVNQATTSDRQDGASWEHAFSDLQDALAAAVPLSYQNVEIWVAAATYRPDRETGDRLKSFRLINGVSLYGGFLGNESQREERDVQGHPTILCGDLLDNDDPETPVSGLAGDKTRHDNSFHVIYGYNVNHAVIDGFTIQNGFADDFNSEDPTFEDIGGGILSVSSHFTVMGCRLMNNYSAYAGGAIALQPGSSVDVLSCVVKNNQSGEVGGGLQCYQSDFKLIDSNIEDNYAGQGGGGISCNESQLIVTDCPVKGNDSLNGGGLHIYKSRMTATNCTMTDNHAGQYGGALEIRQDSNVTLDTCVIRQNQSVEYGGGVNCSLSQVSLMDCLVQGNDSHQGGGVNVSEAQTTATNCTFDDNRAGQYGGALNIGPDSRLTMNACFIRRNQSVEFGGGINSSQSQFTLSNCLVQGNESQFGAGIGVYQSTDITTTNCTLVDNHAEQSGGAFYLAAGSDVQLWNCISWDNRASSNPDIYQEGDFSRVHHSNVQNSPFSRENNLSQDPLFMDPSQGDYRLQADSPCIDKGSNQASAEEIIDLDGKARIINDVVDMGAYEFNPE